MKKTLTLLSLLFIITCANPLRKDNASSYSTKPVSLTLWSFTDEIKVPLEEFMRQNPNIVIYLTIHHYEEYFKKLNQALAQGNGPDIFTAEINMVREIVEKGHWDDLDPSPYFINSQQFVPYLAAIGTDSKGVFRGASFQTTSIGFIYRRSYAKKYLGTDDPAQISRMLSSPQSFLEVAQQIRKKSGGEVSIIPGISDYQRYVLGLRSMPFIVNSRLNIDKSVFDAFAMAETMRNEKLTAGIVQWSPAWFKNMAKDGKVFGYALPQWGLQYIIKKNSKETHGDWAIASGPSSHYWGGSFIGVNKSSQKKEAAGMFVSWFTANDDTLAWMQNKNDSLYANKKNLASSVKNYSDPYCGGQNTFEFYANEALKISPRSLDPREILVEEIFFKEMYNVMYNGVSGKQALINLKQNVRSGVEGIEVD